MLINENKYKMVRKRFYHKIIGYILKSAHTLKSFDKETLRIYIDKFIDDY
jgi:hypothetical protein